MDRKLKGKQGERLVSQYFEKQGFSVLAKNKKIQGIEVDLLVQKKDRIFILEIKNHFYSGSGFEPLISDSQIERLIIVHDYLKRKYSLFHWELYLVHLQKKHTEPQEPVSIFPELMLYNLIE